MNIYDFKVRAQDGSEVSMSDYKGKVLLIVNTATDCGFTPQYDELQDLYDACHDHGLEILDFPCNQFGEQAPGDDEEIHSSAPAGLASPSPSFPKSMCWVRMQFLCISGCLRIPSLRASV